MPTSAYAYISMKSIKCKTKRKKMKKITSQCSLTRLLLPRVKQSVCFCSCLHFFALSSLIMNNVKLNVNGLEKLLSMYINKE